MLSVACDSYAVACGQCHTNGHICSEMSSQSHVKLEPQGGRGPQQAPCVNLLLCEHSPSDAGSTCFCLCVLAGSCSIWQREAAMHVCGEQRRCCLCATRLGEVFSGCAATSCAARRAVSATAGKVVMLHACELQHSGRKGSQRQAYTYSCCSEFCQDMNRLLLHDQCLALLLPAVHG